MDAQKDSFSFDLDDLQKKISDKTKAVVTVPMWGYAINTSAIKEITDKYSIPLIEDASHCHGAKEGSSMIGTTGDVGFFSTQERKLITTGEGGFILTNNDDVADRVKELRDFGKPFRKTPELKDHLGQYGYLFGLNFRIAAMSAALGISQIKKLERKIIDRTKHAAVLRDYGTKLGWLKELPITNEATPNYYSAVFFVEHPRMSAHEIAKRLFEANIVSDTYRFGIKPLYELPIFTDFRSSCPNAESLLQRIITLPTHEGLDDNDIARITAQLAEIEHDDE